jgi:O-antigen ligase
MMQAEQQSPAGLASLAVASEDFWPFLEPAIPLAGEGTGELGFGLFLAATAALLVRPADLFPFLYGLPIYEAIMIASLAISLPRLSHQFFSVWLPARAITRLIFGLLIAIVWSHLLRGSLHDVREGGSEFLKIFLYYLLLLSWVDSPKRMRRFLLCLCTCALALTITALLQYHGWIDLESIRAIQQGDGESSTLLRLCGTGIFHDPNDVSLLLVLAICICAYFSGDKSIGRLRYGWAFPIALFGYAIMLTYSRGGLLALLGAIGAGFIVRFGWSRAILIGSIIVPILLVAFAGRQTHMDLSNPEDTFQTRLENWNNSLVLFRQSPFFGCGEEQQVELKGQVAHNSFLQSYAEMGLFGGAMFLGTFAISIVGVYRARSTQGDPDLARLRPYIVAAVAGYAAGLISLSRAYTVPTYLVVGIAAAYLNLCPGRPVTRLNATMVLRLATASVLFLMATNIFVRVMSF